MNKKELGQSIRAMRLQRGITQAELAMRLGCAPSAVSMYERGEREPDYNTVTAIADALGTTPAHLLNLEEGGAIAQAIRSADDDAVCMVVDDTRPGAFLFFFNDTAKALKGADLSDPESAVVRDVFRDTITNELGNFNVAGLKKILFYLGQLMNDPGMLASHDASEK